MQQLSRRFGSSVDGIGAAWESRLRSAPRLRLPARRTVVVTPDPDEAALSSGGLIMHQMAKGVPVVVVALTDAVEASRGGHTALSVLGVPAAATIRLGLSGSGAHEDEIAARLGQIIEPADVVVAPWDHLRSQDDSTTWRTVRRIARARSCTLVGSLFSALHRVDPRRHPGLRIARLHLTQEESVWRWEALQSQVGTGVESAPIDVSLVERLRQPIEYYVEAP